MTELMELPFDIMRDYRAQLHKAKVDRAEGAFRLVDIRQASGGHEEQRLQAIVLDNNGMPIAGARVAWAFSTADAFTLTNEGEDKWLWSPPPPHKAKITRTQGGGMTELILGPQGTVKPGEAGGVTCYVFERRYTSDVVSGLGMLAEPVHSGLILVFQLVIEGILPLSERLEAIEARLAALEQLWDE